MEVGANQRVGITASAFDLFHTGHVLMLHEAKQQCDFLIAALQIDPSHERLDKNLPVQSIVERYIQLDGCKYVDKIIPYATEDDLLNILSAIKINVRIIGEEYKLKSFTGKGLYNIDTYYNRRNHNFSSTELRERVHNESI